MKIAPEIINILEPLFVENKDFVYRENNNKYYCVVSKSYSDFFYKVKEYNVHSLRYMIEHCPRSKNICETITKGVQPPNLKDDFLRWVELIKVYSDKGIIKKKKRKSIILIIIDFLKKYGIAIGIITGIISAITGVKMAFF